MDVYICHARYLTALMRHNVMYLIVISCSDLFVFEILKAQVVVKLAL